MGKIEAINISSTSEAKTVYINQAFLEKNKGIVNDRYYNNFKHSMEQVTLIDKVEIDLFNYNIKKNIDYKDFRRNIIVSGLNLTKCINKTILINDVKLKIHEICQPCKYLQDKLKTPELVKLLVNKSGVRAEIITSGFVKVNDRVEFI